MGNIKITSTPYDDVFRTLLNQQSGTVEYDIRVLKSQQYTLKEVFEKNLLLLIPFYIFYHEKGFKEYAISEYTRCTMIDMPTVVMSWLLLKIPSKVWILPISFLVFSTATHVSMSTLSIRCRSSGKSLFSLHFSLHFFKKKLTFFRTCGILYFVLSRQAIYRGIVQW